VSNCKISEISGYILKNIAISRWLLIYREGCTATYFYQEYHQGPNKSVESVKGLFR